MAVANQKEITLPAGLIVEGTLIRRIVIREMMDSEEELLADRDNVLDLVVQCIVRIGEHIVDPAMIRSIFQANCTYNDWEVILFELRKLTMDSDYKFNFLCPDPECKKQNIGEKLDLRTVKVRPFIDADTLTRGFTFTAREGAKLVFRDRMWYDVDALATISAKKSKKFLAEMMGIILISVNDARIVSDTWQEHVEHAVELLGEYMPHFNDRAQVRALMKQRAAFGVDKEVITTCHHCNTVLTHSFTVDISFLFPTIDQLSIRPNA